MKVSVITPFFKVAPFIERCAESLLHQTLEDVEFIFVDDASPDESHSILEAVIARHPERDVRIVMHAQNKHLPFRTRLVQWFAAKRLFPLVGLYDFLVNKVYYGLRFRT